jgi:phosphoglycerate dehydrogenase-like enzyme
MGVLVNVGRGDVVDQDALVDVLRAGGLGGAGLDATTPEPLPKRHPLWRIPTAVVTSHVANPSLERPWDANRDEYTAHLARNVAAFAAGRALEGVIDRSLGY